MMDGQMTLDIDKPLDEWDSVDLLDWLSRFGIFEMCNDDQLKRDDVAYSLDVTPPIRVWLVQRTDRWGNFFQDIRMDPVDVADWNRGCPGCTGSFPDWVEKHIRNHTGDNFPNETFMRRSESEEEDDASWER